MNSTKRRPFLTPMISLVILTLLAGCDSNTAEKTDFCSSYRLITISPQDKLTPRTAEAILHDDDQFEAICQR